MSELYPSHISGVNEAYIQKTWISYDGKIKCKKKVVAVVVVVEEEEKNKRNCWVENLCICEE